MKIQDNDALVTPVFFLHPVKDEIATKKEGRPIFNDVEHVRIKLAANKQSVLVAPAHEVFAMEDDPAMPGEKVPMTYAMKYNAQYLAFKSGAAQSNSGTPLEMLSFLTPAKRLELKALNIHTAEALASLGGQGLKNLGMGGRDLVDKAAAYLDDAAAHAGEGQLVNIVAEQDAKIAALMAEIAAMKKDPLDHDGDGEKGGAAPDEETVASPFNEYEDEDIRNWIKEADPALKIDLRWSRKTLIAKADEVNVAMAKKNVQVN